MLQVLIASASVVAVVISWIVAFQSSRKTRTELRRREGDSSPAQILHFTAHGVSGDINEENVEILFDEDSKFIYHFHGATTETASAPDRRTLSDRLRGRFSGVSLPRSRQRPVTAPGAMLRVISGLLPGEQGQEWLDEARDHLTTAAEDGADTQQTRRGLFMALLVSLPLAWYGEIRRRVLRRA